jgi:hypothetical protein
MEHLRQIRSWALRQRQNPWEVRPAVRHLWNEQRKYQTVTVGLKLKSIAPELPKPLTQDHHKAHRLVPCYACNDKVANVTHENGA